MLKRIFLLFISLLFLHCTSRAEKIPLGVIFGKDTNEVQTAFKYAMMTYSTPGQTPRGNPYGVQQAQNNRDQFNRDELLAYVDLINTADPYKLSRIICNQFARGVYAMIGVMNPESFQTFHLYSNTFHMPFLSPWFPPIVGKKNKPDYAIKLRPDLHMTILDTIAHYGWKNIIYLYDSQEGLHRLQAIFQKLTFTNDSIHISLVKKISNSKEALSVLRNIEIGNRWIPKYVVLDCITSLVKDVIISHVRDIQMGRRTYHYLLPGLAFDDPWESSTVEYGTVNITGFRIVNPQIPEVQRILQGWASLDPNQFLGAGKPIITSNAALMYDGVLTLKEAFSHIIRDSHDALDRNGSHLLSCSTSQNEDHVRPFEFGQMILRHLKRVRAKGLTGNIQFGDDGSRVNYIIDVMEMGIDSVTRKIGEWSDNSGFQTVEDMNRKREENKAVRKVFHEIEDVNRTYIVTSILEEPYLMFKKAEKGENLTGNDQFEGFCKDLAEEISDHLGIKFEIRLVKDGAYGGENSSSAGGWDGMVGELIRHDADLAIAPLTITRSRETVIDFSMPYMELGISIMIKKPQIEMPGAFTFVKEADLAISSLTITSERERVIDFSKPFMSLGISIMAYKPKKHNPGVFGFMSPLSNDTWVCVIFAYVGVSLVLFLVSRFNPTEWILNDSGGSSQAGIGPPASGAGGIQNQFSVPNALWFSFAALVQQGSDISPRSLAGRIVGSVWWFFTLILISSYTANFAAVRTVNRMILPIKSADELSKQQEVKYGTLIGGSTWEFFRRSEMEVYKRMWDFMSSNPEINVRRIDEGIRRVREKKGKYALLVESSKNDYTNQRKPCDTMKIGQNLDAKGFGIATPLGSTLKRSINLKVLRMKENGVLSKLEKKWWDERSECDNSNKQETTASDDELSLGSLAGIFYILIIGLVLAMGVSLVEFCYNSKKEAINSQMTLKEAMKQKARITISGPDHRSNNTH